MKYLNDKPMLLDLTMDEDLLHSLTHLWKDIVVMKVLERLVEYRILVTRLQQIWRPRGFKDGLDLDSDYFFFFIKFDITQDLMIFLHEGLWMIQGHYLTVYQWTLEFCLLNVIVNKTLACVQCPELSVIFYNEDVL